MQIFFPYNDYRLSAASLDDKRLNKQIIELGQILSTAIWIENCDIAEALYAEGKIYLPSHENHPVIINCKHYFKAANYYLQHLLAEYKYRFSKNHKCDQIACTNKRDPMAGIYWTDTFCGDTFWEHSYLFNKYIDKPFGNHTTNHKHIQNIYEAYRLCLAEKLNNDKIVPKWTNRPVPKFYKG